MTPDALQLADPADRLGRSCKRCNVKTLAAGESLAIDPFQTDKACIPAVLVPEESRLLVLRWTVALKLAVRAAQVPDEEKLLAQTSPEA